MSEEMPSWRSLASAASRSIKGYVAQREPRNVGYSDRNATLTPNSSQQTGPSFRQAWSQWAGQKLRSLGQNDEGSPNGIEKLALFPGWAARKYRTVDVTSQDAQFDIEVFVSGFSSRVSGPGFGTRAGKTFLRLAKKYAALPKLSLNEGPIAENASFVGPDGYSRPINDESFDVSHLPPRPDEITEESELRELEKQFHDMEMDAANAAPSSSSSSQYTKHSSSASISSTSSTSSGAPLSDSIPDSIQKWHANLEARLHPFWSSALGNRTVRLVVFARDPDLFESYKSPPLGSVADDDDAPQGRPVAMKEVQTGTDGSFQAKFRVRWEDMCIHPGAVHVAFGDPGLEHELFVQAQLLPMPSRPPTPSYNPPYASYNNPNSSSSHFARPNVNLAPTVITSISVPLTHSVVRLISDIDDTVKLSGVLQGARALFQNVFVRDLADSVIPGMGDWYTNMWKRGVRFHYVSNGPFELLPVVNEFLQLSHLPPGSVKLRSYAGRSLFNGLLSAPAERKRQGIADVLDSFPDSRFILVGDSGEQDLELYASFARERPEQVLAIFIRDAGGDKSLPLDDPTGENGMFGWDGVTSGMMNGSAASSPVKQLSRDEMQVDGSRTPNQSSTDVLTPRPRSAPRIVTTPRMNSYTDSGSSSSSSSGLASNQAYPYFAPNKSQTYSSSPLRTVPEPSLSMSMSIPTSDEPSSFPTPTIPNSSEYPSLSTSYPPSPSSTHPRLPPNANRYPPLITIPSPARPSRTSSISSNLSTRMSLGSSGTPTQIVSEPERRQADLQMRVYRARMDLPRHVALRVFREPQECFEDAERILDRLRLGKSG
ncbi:hypothetical protein QCA50_008988 [Cerrena zonata]|uniref:Phosphatidate phosphatase APP1 catalytic domain-containing protein n=1 Tax=Cerrena zonata TaxID=2478898 RepID=A0AAW0G8S5_9APHY